MLPSNYFENKSNFLISENQSTAIELAGRERVFASRAITILLKKHLKGSIMELGWFWQLSVHFGFNAMQCKYIVFS